MPSDPPKTTPHYAPNRRDPLDDRWARRVTERRLRMLEHLAEVGLEAARALTVEARAWETREAGAAADCEYLTEAYVRISRGVRIAIAYQAELLKGSVTPNTADAPTIGQLTDKALDRLEDEGDYGKLLRWPYTEILARIRRDVGLVDDARMAETLAAGAKARHQAVELESRTLPRQGRQA